MEFRVDALTKRPDLAIKIAQVSATWTEIEVSMGILLALIFQSSARIGVAMYLSLTGTAAQRSVLLAVAQESVPAELRDEFVDLLDEVRKRSGERNRIVHAMWGAHPSDAAALVNCRPDNMVRDVTNAFDLSRIIGHFDPKPSQDFVDNLLVYKANDFNDR
jgi:hypothetical protein